MTTICLTIEYDGTDYVGWQVQPNGVSVQQVLEEALEKISGEKIRLHSSGRTDAGVHARGMVAHFRTDRPLPLSAYREGVNGLIPADVAVRDAAYAADDFHARFSALGKWYRYTIYNAPVRSPLEARTSWHIRGRLDEEAMAEGAAAFVGCHDFSAFRGTGCASKTTVREVFSVEMVREGQLLHVDVKGSGFLKNMVRVMVGTLFEIGLGKMTVVDLRQLLQGGGRDQAGRTAAASGLCLMKVWY